MLINVEEPLPLKGEWFLISEKKYLSFFAYFPIPYYSKRREYLTSMTHIKGAGNENVEGDIVTMGKNKKHHAGRLAALRMQLLEHKKIGQLLERGRESIDDDMFLASWNKKEKWMRAEIEKSKKRIRRPRV